MIKVYNDNKMHIFVNYVFLKQLLEFLSTWEHDKIVHLYL